MWGSFKYLQKHHQEQSINIFTAAFLQLRKAVTATLFMNKSNLETLTADFYGKENIPIMFQRKQQV